MVRMRTSCYYVSLLGVFASFCQAEIIFTPSHFGNMQRYYACYFNKYFKLSMEDTKYEADREMFVKAKIEAHQKYKDRAPSPACVGWMCDPKMIWDWGRQDKLETWTYFAQPGDNIVSWGQCFQDEEVNFRDKNYTFSDAGMDCRSLKVPHLSLSRRLFTHKVVRRKSPVIFCAK